MAKYYCGLCEESHHELKKGVACPECGRNYCIESIKSAIKVGKDECPYCDTPFEWFSEIPISIKRKIRKKDRIPISALKEIKKPDVHYFTPVVENEQRHDFSEKINQVYSFLKKNIGLILESPRKRVSSKRKSPMRFKIVDVDDTKDRVTIQFVESGTYLPLDYWRFHIALQHLERKHKVRIGASISGHTPVDSLERILNEEAKKRYDRIGDTKTAPHIADILDLAGVAKIILMKSNTGRKVQGIELIQ